MIQFYTFNIKTNLIIIKSGLPNLNYAKQEYRVVWLKHLTQTSVRGCYPRALSVGDTLSFCVRTKHVT